jgi:hypothetical protein
MRWPFEFVNNLAAPAVKVRRYGVIQARASKFFGIHYRPYPKYASQALAWFDRATHRWRTATDRCLLYFNEPVGCQGFLALAYLVSSPSTRLGTVQAALSALNEVANQKRSPAIVCDASNLRLSKQIMFRYGFEPHALKLGGRHYIKRLTHPPKYEFLRRPLEDIFPEERLAVGEILHA